VVFPGDAPSMTKDPEVYEEIYQVLRSAREDIKKQTIAKGICYSKTTSTRALPS